MLSGMPGGTGGKVGEDEEDGILQISKLPGIFLGEVSVVWGDNLLVISDEF